VRWSGQEITVEQGDALPGLARLSNLVRSVRTPEFAGITFHEVLAKSALNHVPGASKALPYGWTINPYRGCSHGCVYCVSPDTLVLMADGRQKPIWLVEVGDEIYGTEVRGAYRRYVRTTVRAKWGSRKRAYRVTLGDGTELVASADHRFLTERGWKYVRGATSGAEQRPHLTFNNKLMGFGLGGLSELQQPRYFDEEYRRGYLSGMIRGDGMIFRKDYVRGGRIERSRQFRLALADVEALNRTRLYLDREGIHTHTRPFVSAARRPMTAIHTGREADVDAISALIVAPDGPRSDDWRAGFLAGVFDAEGSCSQGALRIANSDPLILADIRDALDGLDIPHVQEAPRSNGVAYVRVVGGMAARQRFFKLVGPAIARKLDIEGAAVKSAADLRVVAIEDLGVETELIDITTGTGDFIANGVIAHNCFARNTHTYLDLDAGRDFDAEIIVKVNVAEVLERELARPSWERPHVALGTNTDPYQRAEGRYRLMPGIIAALAASGTPFSILTKGTLLRRDLPLIAEAAERVPVGLAMSIAVYDPELQESIEPGVPTAQARLATVRAAREAGLDCAVFLMPVLPYLTDDEESLDRAVAAVAESGASSLSYTALHLRAGTKEWFAAWLRREHPDLVPRYRALYGDGAYAPKEYRRRLAARIRLIIHRYGLDRGPLEPTTGTPAARLSGSSDRGAGLLATELSPAAAAALQPTLF